MRAQFGAHYTDRGAATNPPRRRDCSRSAAAPGRRARWLHAYRVRPRLRREVVDRRLHLAGVPCVPVVAGGQPLDAGAPAHGDHLDGQTLRTVLFAQRQKAPRQGGRQRLVHRWWFLHVGPERPQRLAAIRRCAATGRGRSSVRAPALLGTPGVGGASDRDGGVAAKRRGREPQPRVGHCGRRSSCAPAVVSAWSVVASSWVNGQGRT